MNKTPENGAPEAEFGNMLIVKVDSAISSLRKAQKKLQELRATGAAISPFASVYLTFEPMLVSVGDE